MKQLKLFLSFLLMVLIIGCAINNSSSVSGKKAENPVANGIAKAAVQYPAWDRNAIYVAKDRVIWNNEAWEAKWWTQGQEPGTTGEWGVWKKVDSVDIEPPEQPQGLTAFLTNPNYVVLRWIPPKDNVMVAGFNIYQDGVNVATVNTASYTITDLAYNTTYTFEVDAYDTSNNVSIKSAPVSIKTGLPEPPAVPTGLTAIALSSTQIKVTFNLSANALRHELQIDGTKVVPNNGSYTHDMLTPGSTHTYSVRAVNGHGASAWSTPVSATTPKIDIPTPDFKKRALVGFWETWDAVIHSAGHIPLNNISDEYNVICVAFPVILADGTCIFEDNMAPSEDVPEPAEIKLAQSRGKKVLLSIGGATASINLNSDAAVNNFIATAITVFEKYGFDGMDIDIEAGLVTGPSMTQLSVSQTNLIKIIRSITDHFGPDFMLTMAPETAYVTGGTIAYGGPWGAYLPIIDAFRDRLSWLQMQYYNGSMYGKGGASYNAGTVEGMVKQTEALIDGFMMAGNNGFFKGLPASKVCIGLPATPGAGGGYMSPASVQNGLNQLLARYPDLRGLMTWSINWDCSNGYEYANNHGPFLKSLPDVK